jgi:hypothetical protein
MEVIPEVMKIPARSFSIARYNKTRTSLLTKEIQEENMKWYKSIT